MVLTPGSTLKKAVDVVICSLCYIRPEYFSLVLEWMGIVVSLDLSTAAITDDNKEDQQHQQGALTDDSKAEADSEARQAWAVWNDGAPAYQPTGVQDFGHMILDDLHLSTLAVACQSPGALKQLLGSGFVAVLCQGLFEFCTREMLRCSDSLGSYPEGFTDSSKSRGGSATLRPRSPRGCRSGVQDGGGVRTRCSSESSQSGQCRAHFIRLSQWSYGAWVFLNNMELVPWSDDLVSWLFIQGIFTSLKTLYNFGRLWHDRKFSLRMPPLFLER